MLYRLSNTRTLVAVAVLLPVIALAAGTIPVSAANAGTHPEGYFKQHDSVPTHPEGYWKQHDQTLTGSTTDSIGGCVPSPSSICSTNRIDPEEYFVLPGKAKVDPKLEVF
jgi:hypothetical protein